MVCIFDPACELLPPWTKELTLCTVAFLLYLLSDLLPPSPSQCTCRQCVTEGGKGGVKMYCGPYSAGVLHSVSDQIQNLQNCFTTPNKMTSKDDIKEVLRRENQGLKVYKVDRSLVFSMTGTYFQFVLSMLLGLIFKRMPEAGTLFCCHSSCAK
jgi:hypothetical protein